ncbi:MAG: hypothetical protein IJ307_07895 [Bacteroidales bacterium]|nr:hypothetical protein [Bacteroidales bacterium]MBQ9721917.1 hypothetical protein [Bacteroidales bacterium]MBQ9723707.1 hypothetical protein [Bacteroidales bacterium]
MKLELTQGCIAGWLGADGIAEHEMDEQMRARVFDEIFAFLKTKNDGLNQLMQFVLELYGDYECDDEPCECCGDTVDTWTLVLPVEDDSESVLKRAIAEGIESGIAESFDPKGHLKSLKSQS